jgi:hypothetical protein
VGWKSSNPPVQRWIAGRSVCDTPDRPDADSVCQADVSGEPKRYALLWTATTVI